LEALFAVLDVIHSSGILHGDIRKDNIMVPKGGQSGVRFIDFGFARAIVDSLVLSWILKTARGSKHSCRKSLTSVILSRLDVQAVYPTMNIPPTKVMITLARFIPKFDMKLHRTLLSSWYQGV
jgi:serine/threonine protein kinase